MEPQAVGLAQLLVNRLRATPPSARLLVGLCGVPASGKSALARLVIENFKATVERSRSSSEGGGDEGLGPGEEAVVVSLDGWHFTRAQLDGFEDAELAHARRGAHWTFDAEAYTAFVHRLREELTATTPTIYAPSFDHAVKDPTPDAVEITPRHRVVLIEGLYTLLSIDPWRQAAGRLDERWFIQVAMDEARRRLVKRHVVTKIVENWEEGVKRAENNDIPNGNFVLENVLDPTRIIQSVDDPWLALP